MTRRLILFFLALLAALALTSCSDDPAEPSCCDPPGVPGYQNLTERDHVLANLELCYNEQNIVQYTRLLDDNFTFEWDIEQWSRVTEVLITAKMFDPDYAGNYKIISIELTLDYPADSWTAVPPSDTVTYAGETWYYQVVDYDLEVVAEAEPQDITFLAQNRRAGFTIRQSEFEGAQKWRIVEWRDDIRLLAARTR